MAENQERPTPKQALDAFERLQHNVSFLRNSAGSSSDVVRQLVEDIGTIERTFLDGVREAVASDEARAARIAARATLKSTGEPA